jgi:DNA-binding response OmpR family regulator
MNAKSLSALLVEDSVLTAEQLRELMRSVSVTVDITTVVTEKDALNAIAESQPDLIVLDLKLRQGSGFNVLRQVATMKSKPATVVLTNYALPKYRELALLTGADYFLDKARDFKELPGIIESIAQKRAVQAVDSTDVESAAT